MNALASQPVPLGETHPLVAIVIVNYNCTEDTWTCLRSLSNLDYPNVLTIVVENNSPGNDTGKLESFALSLGCVFVRSPENVGFAAANNIGIQYARASEAKYVWLLNPDTVAARGSLSAFVEAAEREPGTVLGGKVLYGSLDAAEALEHAKSGPQAGELLWSAGGSVDVLKEEVDMYGTGLPDDGKFDQVRECDYLPGCSMFLPLEAVDRAGLMPEEFFMYFEETEWCARMKDAGLTLKYLPSSIVWHRFSDAKMQTPRNVYYYNRNQLSFWYRRQSFSGRVRMIARILFKKLPELRRAGREAPDENLRNVFSAHRAACWDFLRGRMGRREGI